MRLGLPYDINDIACDSLTSFEQADEDMAEWVKREYGKGQIDRAGSLLVPWWSLQGPEPADPASLLQARQVVFNWRSSHGLPLNVFQATLRVRAKRVERDVLIAQRLKRFSSIMNKLVREPAMKLSQMQDLGGCRAILSDVAAVDRLYGLYRGGEPLPATEVGLKCYDYIREPKDDGYRGIHIVGRYHARTGAREPWNGQRVEIQLRSRLQHAFATTVETVTTFTRQPLKFGAGPTEWRRFFSLMGSALARREMTPPVNNTPRGETELIKELGDTARSLKVIDRLRGWTQALRVSRRQNLEGFKWLLLVLDTKLNRIKVTGYSRREAVKAVAEIEQAKHAELDAVLVSVPDVNDLKAAYPNYYADTREFITALESALRKGKA